MKAMFTVAVTLIALFTWSAYSAAERGEAAWKAYDARLAAAAANAL